MRPKLQPARQKEWRDSLTLGEVVHQADGWLLACDIDQHSERTMNSRRDIIDKFVWWLRKAGHEECGTQELRGFMYYLGHGHEEAGGRWGNPRCVKPLKRSSIHTYHGHLRTFFAWVVTEGYLSESPMDRIPPVDNPKDEIAPFSQDQYKLLLATARKTRFPRRDEAILLLLLDTGIRASELCHLKVSDIDFHERTCTVLGKGNKRRTVGLGKVTAKALWTMLQDDPRDQDDYLFIGQRGKRAGEHLTRSGLRQLMERLGKAADIHGVRCSPHTGRHTFSVDFLRNGGNSFALMKTLGHTSMTMTQRYVSFAEADIVRQHRQHSPADSLMRN